MAHYHSSMLFLLMMRMAENSRDVDVDVVLVDVVDVVEVLRCVVF